MKTFAIYVQLFGLSATLMALPSASWAGAILTSDIREVDAFASGGTSGTQHQNFQATFGQNPFSAIATATSSSPPPDPPGGAVGSQASLTTTFVTSGGEFQEFSGATPGSPFGVYVSSLPEQFGGSGTAESLVNVTFQVDTTQSLELTGQSFEANMLLEHAGGAVIFTAGPSSGSFARLLTLDPGDYHFMSDMKVAISSGDFGGDFQFDLKFGVTPEPSTFVLAALGGLALLAWRARALEREKRGRAAHATGN